MRLFKLHKTVLRIINNPSKLLGGVTSNTLDAPQNAFLDKFGKIVVVFEQKKINENEILVVVEQKFLQRLYNHIKPFLTLSQAKVQSTHYHVYFDLDKEYRLEKNEYNISQKNGNIIITEKELETTISEEKFTIFRLKNNIPLQGIDYDQEMALNITEDFISFTKGCFLGQEVVARVHNLGTPPKRLVVKYENECNEKEKMIMTSKCIDSETGKVMGFIFLRNV